jgi:hypothetical protein
MVQSTNWCEAWECTAVGQTDGNPESILPTVQQWTARQFPEDRVCGEFHLPEYLRATPAILWMALAVFRADGRLTGHYTRFWITSRLPVIQPERKRDALRAGLLNEFVGNSDHQNGFAGDVRIAIHRFSTALLFYQGSRTAK